MPPKQQDPTPEEQPAQPTPAEIAAKARDYWQGFPEAPYSDSFKWTSPNGFEHLSTVRAWSMDNLLKAIAHAEQNVLAGDGFPPSKAPVAPMPAQTIPMTDETGVPVVDGNTGQPMTVPLPSDTHIFTVKGVYHDQTQAGKDTLKVLLVEDYQHANRKYGITCFRPPAAFDGWKSWPIGLTTVYAPPAAAAKVLIRDPKDGGKYADVLEFRPA